MAEQTEETKPKKKLLWLPLLGAVAGVLLLIFGSVGNKTDTENTTQKTDVEEMVLRSTEAYATELETRVATICGQVKGAGKVKAVVTLSGGYRAVYASDSQSTNGGYKNNTVLIGSGSSEEGIPICYENPEIAGIGIVCDGGGDPAVRANIVSLVSAAFDVASNKIYVAPAG